MFNQAEIDREYNPRLTVADADVHIKAWLERSADLRERVAGQLGLRYGPTVAEYVDIFPASRERAPIHVFFHGGYWRALSAREFSFLAEPALSRGWCTVIVNYALCPSVKLPEIARQARAAISWIWNNAASFGGDRDRLVVSGHSAGGQLVGRLLATDWVADYGMPACPIHAALAISGLFDLEPLRWSWLQPGLQLTGDEIRSESPLHHLPTCNVPMAVAVGGAESESFRQQSKAYCAAVKQRGAAVDYLEAPKRHHFDVLDDLASINGVLWKTLEALTGSDIRPSSSDI